MDIQEWLDSPKTLRKSKKRYSHFDYRTNISKVKVDITNPEYVATHGFYPFIHYTIEMIKYNKKKGKQKKTRDICYAAHVDRCIYQYYAYILNWHYNKILKEKDIDQVPVAYRTDLHDSNIQSAHKAISFIRKSANCYVMIGDFTNFFDNLDHKYLKKQWCKLIGKNMLPDDHYAVFKNVTRYSKWELEDILKINDLPNTDKGIRKLNRQSRVLSDEQFKNNKKCIVKNCSTYGVPQGSPISAVLANIYMLEADELINKIVLKHDGFYMRYSDDFIVVIPYSEEKKYNVFNQIIGIIGGIPNLTLENKKTQFFHVDIPLVKNVGHDFSDDADTSKNMINFLGFSFDGSKIRVRSKTISKYYYRMNRKAKAIAHNLGNVGADHLYMKYSERGARGKQGNFFSYINNAENEFGKDELIGHDFKRHMSKIRKIIKRESKKR